ncbi:MAG: glycosyltransferase family 39 protein [Chloroflexota bacterium]|nr:glycosyltransferase family 39 protein [Chloroflexota bacterium]
MRLRPIPTPAVSAHRVELAVVLALIAYATANAFIWSAIRAPIFGGPDEENHFRLIQEMADSGGWPLFKGYAQSAFAGLPIRAQVAYELTPNLAAVPAALILSAFGSGDVAFDVHIVRLVNVALFPVTLGLAYLTLRRLFPASVLMRTWPLAIMATTPQFTLVFSYVTNDSPAIAASTFAIYSLVRAYQADFASRDSALLGIALGVVALHKFTGFMIFPVAALTIVWSLRQTPRRLVRAGVIISVIVLAVSLWWYVRMIVVYGDPFGIATTQAAVDASGGAPVPFQDRGYSIWQFLTETEWVGENFATFWGGYGQVKLKLPAAAYLLFAALSIAGLAGLAGRLVTWLRLHRSITGVNPLALALATLFFGLLTLSIWSSYSVDMALHGRYLFPEFLPFVVLLALGLSTFAPLLRSARPAVAATIPLMVGGNLIYTLQVIVPDVIAFG